MTPTEYGALCATHAQGVIDGKPTTDYFYDSKRYDRTCASPFTYEEAIKYQWRAIDPLREYKEAFAEGKRVEWRNKLIDFNNDNDGWELIPDGCAWRRVFEYQIVEPKTVKLYPFTIRYIKTQYFSNTYYFESMESAKAEFGDACEIMQINPNGSIEVQS